MATIAQLKSDNNTVIRAKVAANSITTDMDADLRDAVADELLARGIAKVPNTAALALVPSTNFLTAVVENVGIFKDTSTGPANGTTIFAGVGGRFWILILAAGDPVYTREVLAVGGDTTYVLADGQSILGIDIMPVNADTIRIGTTPGGDEVMLDKVFTAGEWDGLITRIYTNGATKDIHISGLTGAATINIYKLKLN